MGSVHVCEPHTHTIREPIIHEPNPQAMGPTGRVDCNAERGENKHAPNELPMHALPPAENY